MKIAVCDDDIAELNNICEILNNYFEEKKYDIYISKFGSSVELASIIQKEKFDIYILDIVMPVLSGMNLATEIRSFDKASDIIFLTSSPEFAVESYCVKATDYILKPVDKNRLLNSINEIAEKRKYEQEKYWCTQNYVIKYYLCRSTKTSCHISLKKRWKNRMYG